MAREHVLVIDDTEMNVKLLTVLLAARGYQVQSAMSVEEAAPMLVRTHFACLLLDLSLPGMDGLTFARQLRSDSTYDDVVIIAVTANAMKGDMEAALAAGCNAYVTKPIDTRTFPTLVADEIAKKRAS
jgi:two-component system cell cycle response regulator DivK